MLYTYADLYSHLNAVMMPSLSVSCHHVNRNNPTSWPSCVDLARIMSGTGYASIPVAAAPLFLWTNAPGTDEWIERIPDYCNPRCLYIWRSQNASDLCDVFIVRNGKNRYARVYRQVSVKWPIIQCAELQWNKSVSIAILIRYSYSNDQCVRIPKLSEHISVCISPIIAPTSTWLWLMFSGRVILFIDRFAECVVHVTLLLFRYYVGYYVV